MQVLPGAHMRTGAMRTATGHRIRPLLLLVHVVTVWAAPWPIFELITQDLSGGVVSVRTCLNQSAAKSCGPAVPLRTRYNNDLCARSQLVQVCAWSDQ